MPKKKTKKREAKKEEKKIKTIKVLSQKDIVELVDKIEDIDKEDNRFPMEVVKFDIPPLKGEIKEEQNKEELEQLVGQTSEEKSKREIKDGTYSSSEERTYVERFDELDSKTYYKAPVLEQTNVLQEEGRLEPRFFRRGTEENAKENIRVGERSSLADNYEAERKKKEIYYFF